MTRRAVELVAVYCLLIGYCLAVWAGIACLIRHWGR